MASISRTRTRVNRPGKLFRKRAGTSYPRFGEPGFLDHYVDCWFKGYRDFNPQLEYIDNADIAKAVAARGKGKTPPGYELFMAAHRVSTRAYCHTLDHCPMGLARRPYVLRYRDKTSGGISGVSAMRYEWVDNTLRIGIRFRQVGLYHTGSFIDFNERHEYQHHKYLVDHGRALIQSVTLTTGPETVLAGDSGRVDDDGFMIFEAPMKSADPAGWAMTVHLQFVKQKFNFNYNLYTGESARRYRRAAEAVRLTRAALAGKPNDVEALIALARARRAAGQVTDAWQTYRAALKRQPGNMGLWDEARDAFASKGLHKQAAEVAALAVKQKPGDIEWRARLVRELFEARLYKAAAAAVADALTLEPEGKGAWQWTMARCLLLDAQYKAANQALEGLEGTVDEAERSVFRYIVARSSKGAVAPEPAAKALRALYDKLEKDSPARRRVGVLLGAVGAGSALQHAKGKAAECEAHCHLGYRYLFAGNKEKAAEHFRRALDTRQTGQFEFRLAEAEIRRLPPPTERNE